MYSDIYINALMRSLLSYISYKDNNRCGIAQIVFYLAVNGPLTLYLWSNPLTFNGQWIVGLCKLLHVNTINFKKVVMVNV
jgi:hypothetical protein